MIQDNLKNKKYVIFGAGDYGKKALEMLGRENVAFFVDNDKNKDGSVVNGLEVKFFSRINKKLKEYLVIVAVSYQYIKDIKTQLQDIGVLPYDIFVEMLQRETKKKIESRPDYLGVYKKAISWIEANTIVEKTGKSIINNTNCLKGYPEVTGYYIPTLIRWGYRELAIDYAKWLISIQHDDGSWYDTFAQMPYVFDTAQILKGLLAAYSIWPDENVKNAIIKGAMWLAGNIQHDGRFKAADESIWKMPKAYSELIHLYCLSPIREVGIQFSKPELLKMVDLSIDYYKQNHMEEILHFDLLSHFYAYVMEALVDLGELELAKIAMNNIANFQTEDGAVPGYNDVHWVCSTGLFQLALTWFRVGDIERGNKAFSYACRLQNESGGWYGSYPSVDDESNDYFAASEISWAVKYFLDALYYKNKAEFDISAPKFMTSIDKDDERYKIILQNAKETCLLGGDIRILDVGCGKGRYLKNLIDDLPDSQCYGVDISQNVIAEKTNQNIVWEEGSLTHIPFRDNNFAMAYTCEALEHAVDIKSAIREMARVVRPDGRIVIVDKNIAALGTLEICEWEQWFDENELAAIMSEFCSEVNIVHDVNYEGYFKEGLFSVWIGKVK